MSVIQNKFHQGMKKGREEVETPGPKSKPFQMRFKLIL